jgi:tRNA-2-methylthio-N6-dimethylallyladenosine synthase
MDETTNPADAAPRVFIETYGCQMNIADSELVAGVLRRVGYAVASRPEEADVVLLNTCAIREHAEERVLGRLSDLARLKHARPEMRLGLLGCMAQHNRAALAEKAPWLDLIAGPDSYRRLPELLSRARFDPAVDVRLDRAETYADIAPAHQGGVRAFVTVMRGCDRFCAFCVVPYVRGRERSVAPQAILAEVRSLAARGVKEIVLLGQTVNAYRYADVDFGRILRMVAEIDGIERIRFTSPHPSDMSDSAIDAMASEKKVQPWLHLPVQSGADRILAAMGRGYTTSEYLALVGRLRAAIPDLALSTDIIVGFHGEEEADFRATLDLMSTVGYDSAFTFKYSLREHTRAYRFGDTVTEEEKGRRLAEVIAIQERISMERNQRLIGERAAVLVEGPARRGVGMLAGKTPQFKTAVFAATDSIQPGDIVDVQVESATAHTLHAAVMDSNH